MSKSQAAAAGYSQLGKNFLPLTKNADTARYSYKLRYKYMYKYKFSVYGQRCLKVHQAAAARYSQLGKNFLPLTHLGLPIKQKASAGGTSMVFKIKDCLWSCM